MQGNNSLCARKLKNGVSAHTLLYTMSLNLLSIYCIMRDLFDSTVNAHNSRLKVGYNFNVTTTLILKSTYMLLFYFVSIIRVKQRMGFYLSNDIIISEMSFFWAC